MTAIGKKELANRIDAVGIARFTRTLFEGVPWLFGGDKKLYGEWRQAVATEAQVNATGVWIVGSAAVGFSLSPNKPGRAFSRVGSQWRKASDIDIALVDDGLFHALWDDLHRADTGGALRMAWKDRASMRLKVYYGAIILDGVPPGTASARTLAARSAASRLEPGRGLVANARVYRRFDDLLAYQEYSLRELRGELT